MNPIKIKSVAAREAYSDSGYPAVEVTVTTDSNKTGMANCAENFSTSSHRPAYLYDGGPRFRGFGVTKAAAIINDVVAPALTGLPIWDQALLDSAIKRVMEEHGVPNYVNISSPVSVAALKAGASAMGMPLYRYIGGQSAFTLPTGGHLCASGSKRYAVGVRAQGRPTYAFVAHDFPTFLDAHYALWETANTYEGLLGFKYGFLIHRGFSMTIPAGRMDSDLFLWDTFVESLEMADYTGKIGIHVDVGANEYYNRETKRYEGLFSAAPKTREELIAFYEDIAKKYPLLILQDPLEENDLEGYAYLTKNLGVQIVGDDIFSSDVEHIKDCIDSGCVDTVLLPVNRFATVSDAINIVRYAKKSGRDVMPRDMCGEGLDVVDYAVGFRAGTMFEGGLDITGNELLLIEAEIGERVRFYGAQGIHNKKHNDLGGSHENQES